MISLGRSACDVSQHPVREQPSDMVSLCWVVFPVFLLVVALGGEFVYIGFVCVLFVSSVPFFVIFSPNASTHIASIQLLPRLRIAYVTARLIFVDPINHIAWHEDGIFCSMTCPK